MKGFARHPIYKWVLALSDFVVLNAAFAVALRLRFMPHIDIINLDKGSVALEVFIFAAYSLLWILIFQWLDLYKRHVVFTKARQIVALLQGEIYGLIGLVLIQFFLKPFPISLESRLMFFYFMVLSLCGLVLYRLALVRPVWRWSLMRALVDERALIVGDTAAAKMLATRLLEEREMESSVLGFIAEDEPVGHEVFQQFKVLGRFEDLPRLVSELKANAVYITETSIPLDRLLNMAETLNQRGVHMHATLELLSIVPKKVSMDYIGEYAMVRMSGSYQLAYFRWLKRTIDILLSLAALAVFSPLLTFIAWKVKRSSPGPVLYRQTRIGKDGRPFDFYKFRSMLVDSDRDEERMKTMRETISDATASAQPLNKVVNASRVTPIGRVLRKYSLDELPQLFNVLKGDMSLVGPRPCVPYEWEAYSDWHRLRMKILPGCTGLWQVMGRSETSFDDMVILDLYYIENMSPWLDLQILLKTVPVILKGAGGG